MCEIIIFEYEHYKDPESGRTADRLEQLLAYVWMNTKRFEFSGRFQSHRTWILSGKFFEKWHKDAGKFPGTSAVVNNFSQRLFPISQGSIERHNSAINSKFHPSSTSVTLLCQPRRWWETRNNSSSSSTCSSSVRCSWKRIQSETQREKNIEIQINKIRHSGYRQLISQFVCSRLFISN